jgi:molybdopterin synthase catalytic subunit
MIAISSAHRRESLAAVEFAIDELKRTVPIWKKVIP